METKNMAFLLKSELHTSILDIKEDYSIEGFLALTNIIDERFKIFGLGKNLNKEVELMLELTELYNKYIQSGDRFILNTIKILKAQLEGLKQPLEESEEITFEDELSMLVDKYGVINPKEVTVYSYELLKKGLANGYNKA